MAKKILINENEFEAFEGISLLALALYIKAIRPYMDYVTGITGWKRGISYQSLAEEVYIEPIAGRHKDKSGSKSKSSIRNAVKELVKQGLISVIPAGKKLVFKLNKAVVDNSVQNRNDIGTTQGSDTGTTQAYTAVLQELNDIKDSMSNTPITHMSDTPPVSGKNNNTTTTTKDLNTNMPEITADFSRGGGGDFSLIFDKQIGEAQQNAIRNALPTNNQATAQALIDELAGVMRNQAINNPVSYFVGIVKRFKAGDFVPTAGVSIAERRARVEKERQEAKARHEKAQKPRSEQDIANNKKNRAMLKEALKGMRLKA